MRGVSCRGIAKETVLGEEDGFFLRLDLIVLELVLELETLGLHEGVALPCTNLHCCRVGAGAMATSLQDLQGGEGAKLLVRG